MNLDASNGGNQLLACHVCTKVQRTGAERCSFCGHALHARKPQSLQRSWCFLITALCLYIPANVLPIMATTNLGNATEATLAGGVVLLWQHHSYLVAAIIFIASLLVPLAKFLALGGILLCEQLKTCDQPQTKLLLFRLTELVGRWSMVDVFVVAFLASLIQLDNLMSITPGPAALAFAGMVTFSMLAANSLDPKLFWDDYE